MLLLDVGAVSVDKGRLQSNNWSFPHVIVGCWHSIRGQDAAVDKTRLQSNNWSFPHVIVGCWHSIRRQDAAAIKQLEFSSCYCWMLSQYPLPVFLMLCLDVGKVCVDRTRLRSNKPNFFIHVIVGCWQSIRRQDAAAIKQRGISSCYCWMLAHYP